MSGLLDPLRRLFDDAQGASDGADGPDVGDGGAGGGPDVSLYACDDCDHVYISQTMDDCSDCGRSVERIPDEAELGLRDD